VRIHLLEDARMRAGEIGRVLVQVSHPLAGVQEDGAESLVNTSQP
jgi:hypothetical protein